MLRTLSVSALSGSPLSLLSSGPVGLPILDPFSVCTRVLDCNRECSQTGERERERGDLEAMGGSVERGTGVVHS